MFRKSLMIAILVLGMGIVFLFAACEEETVAEPIAMSWGIPEEVSGFEGLQRELQGEEVERLDEDIMMVTWEIDESYIVPISATSEQELKGVRYRGSGVPGHLEVEWLDPRAEIWFPLEDLPAERVKAVVEAENDHHKIDFGPPAGADFEEGTTRLIWFRITPTMADVFEFVIFGYQVDGEPETDRVSNVLTLQVEVRP